MLTTEQQVRLDLIKLLNPSGWGATADLDKICEQVRRLEQFVIGSADTPQSPAASDPSPPSKKVRGTLKGPATE